MENQVERRAHERLELRLGVVCQKVGLSPGLPFSGTTVDVSPGGLLMEVNSSGLAEGELISVEMSVPPTKGLLEYGGRFVSNARVLRVDRLGSNASINSRSARSIALEFCESPKLTV